MPKIKRQKIVPYSQQAMYSLVNDVTRYKEFVPWCQKSEVLSRHESELQGELTFAKGGFNKSFTTHNRLHPYHQVDISLVNGPFKHLDGHWQFEDYGNGHCKVSLNLEFEFSTRVLELLFGPLFNQVANTLVDVFCQRARDVYGAANDE